MDHRFEVILQGSAFVGCEVVKQAESNTPVSLKQF